MGLLKLMAVDAPAGQCVGCKEASESGGERERCGENEKPHFAKCACGLVAASLRERISCVVGFNQAKEAHARFRIGFRSQAQGIHTEGGERRLS